MRRDGLASAALGSVLLGSALLAGCGSSLGDPAVTGLVTGVAANGSPRLTSPSDVYFDGITLTGPDADYRDASGATIEAGDLQDGDAVAVWTGSCAESFPVQCELIAVHVTG